MSSIVVANSSPDRAKRIAAALHSGGLFVSCVCTAGAQVIGFAARHYHGGVVVCGMKLRDMPALSLPQMVGAKYDFVFLVGPQFGGTGSPLPPVSLMLPVRRKSLVDTVGMLLNLADATPPAVGREMSGENFDAREAVSRAKGLLIERNGMTERQAHRFIQKKSMDFGRKMAETALIILHS